MHEKSISLIIVPTDENIILQSTLAKIDSKQNQAVGRVFFDGGSDLNFISKKMAKRFNLKGEKLNAEISIADGKTWNLETEEVKFRISLILPQWDSKS